MEEFNTLCYTGRLDEAKILLEKGLLQFYSKDKTFRYTCRRGQLDVAKWLYSLGGIDIHMYNDAVFRYTCRDGHLNVVKWLYSLGGIDIHTFHDASFGESFFNDHIDVAKWLIRMGTVPHISHTLYDYYVNWKPTIFSLTVLHMFVKYVRYKCITHKTIVLV